MNKYEMLYDDKIEVAGRTLYKIRALRDFNDVKAGNLGGYIEGEENLSQDEDCWVYGNAQVYGDAHVYGNAWVYGNAQVYGDAHVYGNAWVYGNAQVYGNAWVYGNAKVYGDAWVCGNAWVYGNAKVYGDAWVCGNAWVHGDAKVYGDALISKINDILCVANIGSRNDTTTFFKTKDNKIGVKCGRFTGTIDDFLEAVNETHGENKHAKAYKLACELARVQILED